MSIGQAWIEEHLKQGKTTILVRVFVDGALEVEDEAEAQEVLKSIQDAFFDGLHIRNKRTTDWRQTS